MGSNARLIKDQRGMVLVYIALIMVALCAFVALAVDMGYMYLAKGELQNAADAAALAGAARLPAETEARNTAQSFAAQNAAATAPVTIANGGGNVLSPENDITVGNWSQARIPPYIAGQSPINAIEVRARRTAGSPDGAVDLFFARVVNSQWAQMDVSASAIARRPTRAGFYFAVGRLTCETTSFPLSLSPSAGNMAWTSLLNNSTNTSDTRDDFICPADAPPDVEVCRGSIGESIYTTNGTANSVFQAVEVDFYDPEYDRINKTYRADGTVSTWTIIVPVTVATDPSIQPAPQPVWGYARIVLTRACGSGGGSACPGRPFEAPGGVCAGGESAIVISEITCIDCANSSEWFGARPSLVR